MRGPGAVTEADQVECFTLEGGGSYNHWLIDTALLSHLGPVPATGIDWTAAASLTGLAVICALAGLTTFRRRDLAAA